MTATKTPQRRPLENKRLRQRPSLAWLHRAAQFNSPQRSPKPCRPDLAAQSTSKRIALATMQWWVDRAEQTDCPPELQKQKASE
jgi:hypothetical protein